MRTWWKFNIRCICSTDKVIKTACSCWYILVKTQQFDFLRPTLRREHYNEEFRSTLRHEHYNVMANFQKIPRLGFICSHSIVVSAFSLNYILGVRWGEGVRWRGGGGSVSVLTLCSHSITFWGYVGGGSTLVGEGVRWSGGGGGTLVGGGGLLDVGYVEGVRREDRSKTAQKPLKSCLKNRSKITARNERFLSGFLSKI